MNNVWKRTGWVLLGILPIASSFALQLLLGVLSMLPVSILAGIEAASMGMTDIIQVEAYIQEAVFKTAPIGVLVYHVASLPIYGLWYYFGCGRPKAVNLAKVIRPVMLPGLMLCSLGLSLLSYGLIGILQYITPQLIAQYTKLAETAGLGVSWFTIIASIVLAPIGEEILCRGITLHYLMKATNGMKNKLTAFWIANAIQALLFGILHFNFVQGLYAFFIGLILGGLTYAYKSLYPAMLVHFIVNILGSFVMPNIMNKIPEYAAVWVVVLIVGILLVSLSLFRKRKKEWTVT